MYQIELDDLELGQVIDGLEIRAECWEKTSEYLHTGKIPDGEIFIIEECSNREEAERIAAQYRTIIRKIQNQMKT